ncbi:MULTISPECIES: ABC transporter ATP-binding protein [Ramlibacter]|uniref:ABC transporter ATP-binding protein n=1 Tax=Ramlibacter aquaticus TaxID=2780094 RepID=A0ABR9SJA5_9BURK|nr:MULTISPECIES: ABC transporter ATP-binding protein [Ramlibacter]MBE7942451.1 ABC transporter ATP-binding protein [Ramlibacter aquaticus]
MTASLLQVQGLRVQRGGQAVLDGIDLQLAAGRWVSVVGPNGAGKSTLLQAAAQLLPYSGSVRWLGHEARHWPARERARTLSWLGQNETGAEDLLAFDVVMLGRLPHQDWLAMPSAADLAAVEQAMRETQCWPWRQRQLGELSGGERQRVRLARALAVQAPVLLMDEPLANLDPPHQSDWLASVRAHVGRGGSAVTVLHEITLALHADEMLVVEAGRIAHQGPCGDAATHRALEAVFGGRIAVREIEGQWVALPRVRPGD